MVEGDLFSTGRGFDEEVEGREEVGLEEVVWVVIGVLELFL